MKEFEEEDRGKGIYSIKNISIQMEEFKNQ